MIINYTIIPMFVIIIIMFGLIKGFDIYDLFIEGCKEGINLAIKIIPPYFAMVFAINIFNGSGVINFIINNLIIVPKNIRLVIPMALVRPISGTASLAILNQIFSNYGPDSLVGNIASTLQGCTDTTFYVLALYFGSIKIKKTRYALIVGLMADLVGVITAIIVVYLFLN